ARPARRGRAARRRVCVEPLRRRVCALVEAAEAYRHRACYRKAESLLRQALAIAAKAPGRDDLAVATLLNNLAVVRKDQGRFAEAGRLYRRALPLLEQALGPEHPEVASVYHNLGGPEAARGEDARGEPVARRPRASRAKRL